MRDYESSIKSSGSLTEDEMRVRDHDVDWFDKSQPDDLTREEVGGKTRTRRWFSLDLFRSSTPSEDEKWLAKSKVTEAEKKRFNAYDTGGEGYETEQRRHPVLFWVSVAFVAVGALSIVLTMILSTLSQGGWYVDLPVRMWGVLAVVSAVLCISNWVYITSNRAHPGKLAIIGSVFTTILLISVLLGAGLYVRQLIS